MKDLFFTDSYTFFTVPFESLSSVPFFIFSCRIGLYVFLFFFNFLLFLFGTVSSYSYHISFSRRDGTSFVMTYLYCYKGIKHQNPLLEKIKPGSQNPKVNVRSHYRQRFNGYHGGQSFILRNRGVSRCPLCRPYVQYSLNKIKRPVVVSHGGNPTNPNKKSYIMQFFYLCF